MGERGRGPDPSADGAIGVTRRSEPVAPAPRTELTYVQALAASDARRMAADDVVLRGMLQDSIHATAIPARA
jgi:hypothetical protein